MGTKCSVEIMRCALGSFLNKDLSPLSRIQMIWCANIFLRYWHTWIEFHPQYNIQDNLNAYICIELNAHALVLLLVTLRDNVENSQYILLLPLVTWFADL